MESSNLFQRRLHHAEHSNYDFVGGDDDTHESNRTNTLKGIADKNDNLKLNNIRELSSPGVGGRSSSKMESQMGKSVKFEVNTRGSVTHLIKIAQ